MAGVLMERSMPLKVHTALPLMSPSILGSMQLNMPTPSPCSGPGQSEHKPSLHRPRGGDDFARAVVFGILAGFTVLVLAVFGWVGVVAPVFLQNVEVFVILLGLRGHAVNPAITGREDDLRLAIDLSE